MRAADEDQSVLTGAQLVPGLLALLRQTLDDTDDTDDTDDPTDFAEDAR